MSRGHLGVGYIGLGSIYIHVQGISIAQCLFSYHLKRVVVVGIWRGRFMWYVDEVASLKAISDHYS